MDPISQDELFYFAHLSDSLIGEKWTQDFAYHNLFLFFAVCFLQT